MANKKVRLHKYMADNGVASRRKSEELIQKGKVKVNGHPAQIGDQIDPYTDLVTVAGKRVQKTQGLYYIMLHKPRGYVTTTSDELGRKCVTDLIKGIKTRVYPVGRLDRDSEGLIFLTNDGAFANLMTHPSKHVPKTYRATIRPGISDEQIRQMEEGVVIDGRKTAPCEITVLDKQEGRVVLQIILHEGRNRQIRKMCEAVGLELPRLKRTAIGQIKLGMLPQGQWRHLEIDEIKKLAGAQTAERARKLQVK